MTGTQQAIAAALRSAAEEVRMSPEQVEQRYVELRERQESVAAGPGGRRRRVVVAAAALGAAAAVAVGVALAGWPGGDAAPAPAVTQDGAEGDARVVELFGGERVEPGGRYTASIGGLRVEFTAPRAAGERELTYNAYGDESASVEGGDDLWMNVSAPTGVYAATGTWVGQRSLVPAPADPQAWFAYLADLGLEVSATAPGDVGGRPALVADVEAPTELPADRVGCGPELIPCVALAPAWPQALGLAGAPQHGLWAGDVTRQWALEIDDRLVVVVAGSSQADPGLAAAVGEELAASISWR